MKLTARLHLVPGFNTRGVLSSLPHTSSERFAKLVTGIALTFMRYRTRFYVKRAEPRINAGVINTDTVGYLACSHLHSGRP